MSCFIGIKTHTAMSILVEVGDFERFESASKFSAFLGLVPSENSSGDSIQRYSITKAGNSHLRRLLIEAAQSYTRGNIGHKSITLKQRQQGCLPEVIAYADKANERLRRRFYRLTLKNNLNRNIATTVVARELSCFLCGGMNTGNNYILIHARRRQDSRWTIDLVGNQSTNNRVAKAVDCKI